MAANSSVQICLTGDLSIDYRVHKTAISLIKQGWHVQCISRNKKEFGALSNQPYQTKILKTLFKTGALFYAEYNVRLFFYLLLRSSQVVLSIDLDTLTGCFFATRIRNRRLVFDSHEYFPEVPELQHRPMIKSVWIGLERFLVPKVDKAYTVCESIANLYKDKYGKDFKVVRNLPLAKRLQNAKGALNDKRFKLVYQGAVNLGRGIFETLDALKMLDDVVFVIVGAGDEINRVKEYVNKNELGSKVQMVGKVPFDELASYTQSADVGMCLLENIGLNYYYSLPNRIFDFALAGVPVLASRFPEIEKVVSGYGTGKLIDDLNAKTIADAIIEMQNDKEQYQQMVENSINASKELTWENEESILYSLIDKEQ